MNPERNDRGKGWNADTYVGLGTKEGTDYATRPFKSSPRSNLLFCEASESIMLYIFIHTQFFPRDQCSYCTTTP